MALTDINATSSSKGTFRQGETVNLYLKVTELGGTLVDPYSITCTVSGPIEDLSGSQEVSSGISFKADNGFYIYSWNIEIDAATGTYEALWFYIVDDVEIQEIQTVVVTDSTPIAPYFYTETWKAYRAALEHHIACAQAIPILYEQDRQSYDNMTFDFSFKNWNSSSNPRVYKNEILVAAGFATDYDNGRIVFSEALMPQEQINIDYNFRWFTDDELNRFLLNALQTVNVYPPHTGYALANLPARYSTIVLYGAAKDALRQLMMCLQFQQPQQVFGGAEQANQAFSNMETLKQNYSSDWEKLLEQKKLGPYPSAQLVVTPEYTLPGGRCLHPDTELLVLVTNRLMRMHFSNMHMNVYTKEINSDDSVYSGVTKTVSGDDVKTHTIKEIYELFHKGYDVEVLSQSDLTGNLVFSPIDYIWESGVKTIYKLKTSNGYEVKASDEHLFYINGGYIPLKDIKIGDEIVTCDNHKWEYSTVKSISQSKRKIKMYDLEIFATANLFANGIKCHNSRWFRYLFKGGG